MQRGNEWFAFFDEPAGIAEFGGRAVARSGRGPGFCLLRYRVAEPKSCALVVTANTLMTRCCPTEGVNLDPQIRSDFAFLAGPQL